MIYVTSTSTNSVYVIDGSSNTLTDPPTISVSSGPTGVSVNPVTNTIYVNHSVPSGLVTAIDGVSRGTSTISVDPYPVVIAVNPVTNTIYAAGASNVAGVSTVSVIDGDGVNPLVEITLPTPYPHAIAVNPDNNRIFVTTEINGGPLYVIDGATNTIVDSSVSVGTRAYGMTVNPATNLVYVAVNGDSVVKVVQDTPPITPPSFDFTIGAGAVAFPHDVAVDSNGDVYVASFGGSTIEQFTSDGTFVRTIGTGDLPGRPTGLTIDANENIVTTNYASHQVKVFDQTGDVTNTIGGFLYPYDIAVDSNGNHFVTDSNHYEVDVYDSTYGYLFSFGSHGTGVGQFQSTDGPLKITVDDNDAIYVGDPSNTRVQKFITDVPNNSATSVQSFNTNRANASVVDSEGNVYIASDFDNHVEIFDSSGVLLTQFGSTGTGPGQLSNPTGITLGSQNEIIVSDGYNDRIQVFTAFIDPPPDADGDGVIDANDLCPATPAGTPVDATGCPLSNDPVIPDSATVAGSAVIGDGTVLGENVIVRKDVVIGNDVTIGDDTKVRKGAQVGDGSTIGSNSIVAKNTVIGNDVTIGDDTKVRKGAQVGNNVTIGDNTIIRKNVTIGDGAIIGNDVIIRQGATVSPGAIVPDGTIIKKNSTFP